MRFRTILPLVALPVVAVLTLAVLGLRYERKRLLGDYAEAQEEVAVQLASDLDRELGEFDDDARLASSLLGRGRDGHTPLAANQKDVLLSGFQALATVVRHYRALSVFRRHQTAPEVQAIDPAESQVNASAFLDWSANAAERVFSSPEPTFDGPNQGPDGRQFFVYARPANAHEAIVLVSEARYLLQAVLRSRAPSVQYVLVDPSRSIWLGCSQAKTCRTLDRQAWQAQPGLAKLISSFSGRRGRFWSGELIPPALGLESRPAAIAWAASERHGRSWILAVIASAQPIEARQRSLFWWLFATSVGLAGALSLTGMFVIRHQRRTVALAERLRNAQEVAHLRERTEKLIENVSVGLVGITAEGRVVLTNRFLNERVTRVPIGVGVDEALGADSAEAAGHLRKAVRDALTTQRVHTISGDEITLFPAKAGHFDLRIIPLKQPAQDVSALILVDDLSELKSLEKQLVRAEKLITVGVLTAGLAHEIGTPLGIIRGRAELLLTKVSDPTLARDIESVIRQIDQIGSVIRQVLDFSRAQPVELRSVVVRDAVDAALAMLDWRLRQKSIFVRVDTDPHALPISADPDQLQQVLVNLLLNACDACEKQGAIMIRVAAADGRRAGTRIEIEDNGCGIATEDLNAVFDPFYTTKKRGEGTGLGLPVAASIVRNHQGEISLRSQKGVGSTVVITWPVAQPEARAHG